MSETIEIGECGHCGYCGSYHTYSKEMCRDMVIQSLKENSIPDYRRLENDREDGKDCK